MEYKLVGNRKEIAHDFELDVESTDTIQVDRGCAKSCCIKAVKSLITFCHDCCGICEETNECWMVRGSKYGKGILEAIFAFNYCYWFQVIIHNKFCNFLFKCGCTWNWDGGWKDCNVHNTEGPRCPWCMSRANISWTTDYLLTFLMIVTYLYLLSKRKKIIGHPIMRLFAPILVYFAAGTVVGACFLVGGYPYFIF